MPELTRSVTLGARHFVTLSRCFSGSPEDIWDALTRPERLARWFLPVRLEEGGRFQLEGNAGGRITRCEPPSRLSLTWEFGGDVSWVEVKIGPDSRLTLTHASNPSEHWDRYGPAATGVGWEMSFRELAVHFGESLAPTDIHESATGWEQAAVEGGADPEAAAQAAARTAKFYSGG